MKVPNRVSNADLPHVGRGTPAGEWLRRYWMVVGTTEELRDIPQPVKVLGEELVLFRNTSGQIGLVEKYCPHRGASLEYGDVEDQGIRCPYHGWLFDRLGRCLEMPAEPIESNFRSKVRHASYPVRVQAGFVFAYLGPDHNSPPPLPRYQALAEDVGRRSIEPTRVYDYNWFNFIENGADPAHFSILHRSDPNDGTWRSWFFDFENVPVFDAVETSYGMKVVSRKPGPTVDTEYVDEKSFALPSILQIGDTEFTHFKKPREALTPGSHNAHFMFVTPKDDYSFTLYTLNTGRRVHAMGTRPARDHRHSNRRKDPDAESGVFGKLILSCPTLSKYTKVTDPETLAQLQHTYAVRYSGDRIPYVRAEGVEEILKRTAGKEAREGKAGDFIDNSLLKDLEQNGWFKNPRR